MRSRDGLRFVVAVDTAVHLARWRSEVLHMLCSDGGAMESALVVRSLVCARCGSMMERAGSFSHDGRVPFRCTNLWDCPPFDVRSVRFKVLRVGSTRIVVVGPE